MKKDPYIIHNLREKKRAKLYPKGRVLEVSAMILEKFWRYDRRKKESKIATAVDKWRERFLCVVCDA